MGKSAAYGSGVCRQQTCAGGHHEVCSHRTRRHRSSCQHRWPRTDGNEVQPFAQTKENKANFLEAHIPTKRMAMPEGIANAIVFIGSDKASYIIGASLAVDGGMLAGSCRKQ